MLKQDFTFIQETHMTGTHTVHVQDENIIKWTFINSGSCREAAARVGTVLYPTAKLIESEVTLEGRILAARLIVKGTKITAICADAPTDVLIPAKTAFTTP